MKSKLIRLSSVAMVVVLLVLLACPAFAEEINYRDYVTHVDVDGDNDLVTVTIPGEWCEGQIVYGAGTELREWLGPSVSWDFTNSVSSYDKLRVYIAPFGTAYGSWYRDYVRYCYGRTPSHRRSRRLGWHLCTCNGCGSSACCIRKEV